MTSSLILVGAASAVLSLAFLLAGVLGLRRRQFSGVPANLLLSLVLLGQAALCGLIVLGIEGYRTLTHESLAAIIETSPIGPGSFRASITLPSGGDTTFILAGDEIYIDAHILKWRSIGTFLGLKTAYELDRIAGRYSTLDDERRRPRTVYSLARRRRVDLFNLRRRSSLLDPLVDAEYGSASFITAQRAARFELRVSPTGLLLRETARPED